MTDAIILDIIGIVGTMVLIYFMITEYEKPKENHTDKLNQWREWAAKEIQKTSSSIMRIYQIEKVWRERN
jgi:heme/copper-type cytochrome/quinol oxidase subunit 1